MFRRLFLPALVLSAALAAGPAGAARTFDFSGWHLPLPAGAWLISRGPCASPAAHNHQCGYYEDQCALDLVSPLGDMTGVPVLAPQAGQVFFLGTREDGGLGLILRHADGRASVFFHLSKAVVRLDEYVAQGQVIAYAGGTGSSTNPHLHFHVQPSVVERACVPLTGLDTIDLEKGTAASRNRAWTQLTLPDPPALPGWLPAAAGDAAPNMILAPSGLALAPAAAVTLPVGVRGAATVLSDGLALRPTGRAGNLALFTLNLTAPPDAGTYELKLAAGSLPVAALTYSVRPGAPANAGQGIIRINPVFVSPRDYFASRATPALCWSEASEAGLAPLEYKVVIVGASSLESLWQTAACYQPPRLAPGTYLWKVFVRDARGYMNRTNQRPYAFVVYSR
jgi:murein DD-endopeptidase MepM/ murein hydrolase activator NlpD